ncbi:MAG TPA: site-2 protease family protein [Stenomitos sp.]
MQNRARPGWQVGTIFGIPLLIDPSWLFIVGLFTLGYGSDWQTKYPSWETWQVWGGGLAMSLLLFMSVLVHELGHSLVAKAQGTKVNSITLFLFGGIASLDEEAKTPGKAFQVAIAGPLVSITLFVVLRLLLPVLTPDSPLAEIVGTLASINLVLTLFNLIPGLPLDGGQVLKALVWQVTGSRFKGVHWAARIGQFLGWTAVVLGLTVTLLSGFRDGGGGLWIALLGWFAVRNASAYDRFTDLQEVLLRLQAKDAMTRDYKVIDADQSLRSFADSYVLEQSHSSTYFAASQGRYRGLVKIDDLHAIERSEWEQRPVQDITHPLTEIATVRENTPLAAVIQTLEAQQLPMITVLTPADSVAGIVDRGDIVRAVGTQMQVRIPAEDIRRIKEEGTFPATFQLQAIAKAVLSDLDTEAS